MIGCNVGTGIIDAVRYVVTALAERSRRATAPDRIYIGTLPERTHAVITHAVSVSLAESAAKVDS